MGGMIRIAANAALYWAATFAVAFVIGAARTLWLAPRVGALAAVLAELPVMLAVSWVMARAVLRRRPLASRRAALAMGSLAFVLLMGAELALATLGFGQSAGLWLAALATPPGLAGLAGQAGFALMPVWVWGTRVAQARRG